MSNGHGPEGKTYLCVSCHLYISISVSHYLSITPSHNVTVLGNDAIFL